MRRDEFERLALAELDSLYRFARFLTRSAEDAEELVQDVFARAFRPESIEGFTSRRGGGLQSRSSAVGDPGMRAWLMTIARTMFFGRLDHGRAGRRVMDRLRQAHADEGGSHEAPDPSRVAGIDWTKTGPALNAALDLLSADLRDVLWLWAVEGLKYREISAALGVPIGTVMSRLHRARSQAARFVLADGRSAELRDAGVIVPPAMAAAVGRHQP